MDRSGLQLVFVFLIACLLRPDAPVDTRYVGGSVRDALALLASAGAERKSNIDKRAFDGSYRHWAAGTGGTSGGRLAGVGLRSARDETPVMAGLVGLASVVGLRDLAAVCLYILSDEAEHRRDWELCELALSAIPFVDPHFVDAYLIRAYFYRLKDPAKAEHILRMGARWNPDDWELWTDLAWTWLRPITPRPPDFEKALAYLRAAVSVKHPWKVRRLYAYVLAHLGRWKEAREVFARMASSRGIPEHDRLLADRGIREVDMRYDRLADRFRKWRELHMKKGSLDVHEMLHHHHHHEPHLDHHNDHADHVSVGSGRETAGSR